MIMYERKKLIKVFMIHIFFVSLQYNKNKIK